nr:harmonin-like isoform X1 [Mirounga angustirostris]
MQRGRVAGGARHRVVFWCCLWTECPVCCAVSASTRPHNPCHVNTATSAQKGEDKKKAKYDSLQELRKNKKELEFEQKLYKEKEEMLEKEKQLKINRLAQEVSETEREDLEESEKIQYWVERLCQTRLEQISSADNEISEMTTGRPLPPPSVSPLVPPLRRFAGGLHLHTTDLDDIPLDMFYYPPKTPSALPVMPHPPPSNPSLKVPAPPVLPSSGHVCASSSPWVQRTPPPIPIPPPPSIPTQDLTPTRPLPSALEEALGNHPFRAGDTGDPTEDWEAKNHSGKPTNSPVPERSFPPTPKVLPLFRMLCREAERVGRAAVVSPTLCCFHQWRLEETSLQPIFQA